jgi:hypothetical protein
MISAMKVIDYSIRVLIIWELFCFLSDLSFVDMNWLLLFYSWSIGSHNNFLFFVFLLLYDLQWFILLNFNSISRWVWDGQTNGLFYLTLFYLTVDCLHLYTLTMEFSELTKAGQTNKYAFLKNLFFCAVLGWKLCAAASLSTGD